MPMIFMVNKITKAKVVLDYSYLWYKPYLHDVGKNIKSKIIKNKVTSGIVKIIERFLVNNFVDYIILGTIEALEMIKDKNRVLPIKEGIIIENFNPKKVKEHKIFKKIKGKSMLFAGRLVLIKDPITLIKAYKIAKKEIKDLNLIICGDGELRKECEKIADNNVYFLGYVKEIPEILKSINIYIQSSAYDSSPRSLLEAMAMGKACIATNVGGVRDYLEGCGILIEPKNPEKLAEKIIYLIRNPKIAKILGIKAKKRIIREHNLEKNIEKEIKIVVGENFG